MHANDGKLVASDSGMADFVCRRRDSIFRLTVGLTALLALSQLGSYGAVADSQVVTLMGEPAPADVAIPQGDEKDQSLTPNQMPTLTLSPTQRKSARGTVMILPGGGYRILAYDRKVVAMFNDLGYDAAVLDYHVRMGKETRELALKDALQAWALIDTQADTLGLSRKQLCVIGFSAGGHLAAALTQALAEKGQRQPDRVILGYPAYLEASGGKPGKLSVSPPAHPAGKLCVVISPHDSAGWVRGAKAYAEAWKAAGGKMAYHELETAEKHHGYGFTPLKTPDGLEWPGLLIPFLEDEVVGKRGTP